MSNPALESVGHLFGTKLIFRVLRYQRYYGWDAEQISDFLTDLGLCLKAQAMGMRQERFFGGIVTEWINAEGGFLQNIEVIDEQQRLTCFSISAAGIKEIQELNDRFLETMHPFTELRINLGWVGVMGGKLVH